MNRGRPAEVLLVEDNDDDVVLTREGFAQDEVPLNLRHVENGQECMRFLRKEGRYAGVPTPDLVLLDLNMPVMDGREVLAEICEDRVLRYLPVVILTTSSADKDVLDMYRLRCSSYVVKPLDLDDFLRAIRSITRYWFAAVALPECSA